MVEWLQNGIPMETLVWLFLIVFMLHDFEEIILVEHWIRNNRGKLNEVIPARLLSIKDNMENTTTAQFSVGVAWIFIVLSCVILYTVHSLSHGGNFLVFVAALNVMFANVFTHVGQAILVRRYVPGVVTALLLLLPYCLYTYYRLLQEQIDWNLIGNSLLVSVMLVPVIFIGLMIGKKLPFLRNKD